MPGNRWPELPYEEWKDTCQTFNRWMQILGKIRLSKSRWVNHSWHTTLYVTARGLTTSVIHDSDLSFSMDLDLVEHRWIAVSSDGRLAAFPLREESVASFHRRCFAALEGLGVRAEIHERPNEVPDPIPLAVDETHCRYDPDFANRFWRILLQADRLMKRFRSDFVGKASPVHFFWGSNDLAVTRFSGRKAPPHPGGIPNLPDLVTREAYSHEVSSCGFWPGNDAFPEAAFYSYAYPEPEGFSQARILPPEAFYHARLREYLLPYRLVRESSDPDAMVLDFLQSTYVAAASLGHWDRNLLENSPLLSRLQQRQQETKRSDLDGAA